MEYKDTLLMPKTDFAMRGNLAKREVDQLKAWEEMNLYGKMLENNEGNPTYVLHDGPPYANGNIHIGHALNKILKDFVVRYKNAKGFQTPFIPGWDTHGLPIETALTKSGVNRKEHSIAEFRKLCEKYALEQVANQKEQFKRLQVIADWENPYITLQHDFEAEQIKVFAKMAERGLIYKGQKPVYWSPSSESALAEAEIEYHDHKSPSIYVAFKTVKANDAELVGSEFMIWTTTPWTIPANLAVAVGDRLDYSLVQTGDRKFVLATDLVDAVAEAIGWEEYTTVKHYKGVDLVGCSYTHPLNLRENPVLHGHHVTTDGGTGLVHIAPGHGEDDFIIGQENGLDVLSPVDGQGRMTEEAGAEFAGMFYEDANKAIGMKLEEVGSLLKLKFIKHSYPHDWRTKKPVIFRATPQWFASIDPIREDLLKEVSENIEWFPKWGETRLFNMIRDRGDWCISRQRAWGVPIPIFYAENGEEIMDQEVFAHVADLFEEFGSNVWFEREAKDLLPAGFTHPSSPNGEFTKETDIMDVWFDSGSSHTSVAVKRGLGYSVDLYLEGSDQYRGWFNSSIITGVAVHNKAPYKTLVSHGFVLDDKGNKMSKSQGNVVDPQKLIKQYGADILRLWAASVDYQQDVRIGQNAMKQVAESYRKIRNTYRFVLGNLNDFNPETDLVSDENLHLVDQYMLAELDELLGKVYKAYDEFDFGTVYKLIVNYVTQSLSNFYLDFTKDILYIDKADSVRRRSVQTVLFRVVDALIKVMVPYLPFTTEEAYKELPGTKLESVHLTRMPEVTNNYDMSLLTSLAPFFEVRDDVLKALEVAREQKLIGKSLEASVKVYATGEYKEVLETLKDDLKQLFIVSKVEVVETELPLVNVVGVEVSKANGHTCERCWNVYEDAEMANDEICERCAEVLA
jgi:isoleucyl-tRNA synthetase